MLRTVPSEQRMPEGDTIHYAANRIRPLLAGHVPDEIRTPHPRFARDRWPERLAGRAVTRVDVHGKHLFLRFEGDLTLHSHLRMTGAWGAYRARRALAPHPRRAWLVISRGDHDVVEFDGPVLELMTDSRTRLDPRIAGLGPDILAPELDEPRILRRLREDDPTRPIGDALLDQRDGRRHRQPVEVRGLLGGAGRSVAKDRRRDRRRGARDAARGAPAHAGERASTGCARAASASTGAPAGRARAAGRRSACAARATATGRPRGARDASGERAGPDAARQARRAQGRPPPRARQHAGELPTQRSATAST